MSQPEDLRWTSAALLVALVARNFKAGQSFTSAMARGWVPQLKEGRRLKHAIETFTDNGWVTSRMVLYRGAHTMAEYTLTKVGGEAVKGAASGPPHKSGPKGPHKQDRQVPAGTFAARLWALMRARRMLDTETAASTLVDAGDDVATASKTAQRYLARWASTGAIAVSAKREANGCKRYVLQIDTPNPPAWTPRARARAEEASSTTENP
jgi:hypothetical protein